MNASLWDFSCRFYRDERVAAACLALQDAHGADVNILLFALWAAHEGRRLTPARAEAAREAVRAWQDEVVRPLRAVRRVLPRAGAEGGLRRTVKACELEAERHEQAILAACATDAASHTERDALARENLRLCLAAIGAAEGAHEAALLEAFARFPNRL